MFEPATLLGLLTLWAQLNNYGIDTEKNPHLKNIRVRRDANQPYSVDNKVDNSEALLTDSMIMKTITGGMNKYRYKRNNDVEATIPLASYPSNSPYYSQNNAEIPYYYSPYTERNTPFYGYTGQRATNNGNRGQSVTNNGNRGQGVTNNGYRGQSVTNNGNRGQAVTNNGNRGQSVTNNGNRGKSVTNNGITGQAVNNNEVRGQNVPTGYDSHRTQMTSGKYVMADNGFYSNGNGDNGNIYTPNGGNSNPTRPAGQYNPYGDPKNQTVIPLISGNKNGTDINRQIKIHNNRHNISTAAFMSGIGCPKFMQSITVFGRQVCVDASYDYE